MQLRESIQKLHKSVIVGPCFCSCFLNFVLLRFQAFYWCISFSQFDITLPLKKFQFSMKKLIFQHCLFFISAICCLFFHFCSLPVAYSFHWPDFNLLPLNAYHREVKKWFWKSKISYLKTYETLNATVPKKKYLKNLYPILILACRGKKL